MDLRGEVEELEVDIAIDTAQLDQMNLANRYLYARGGLKLKVRDLNLDRFEGNAYIVDGFVDYEKGNLFFDSLKFSAGLLDSVRRLEVSMPGLDAHVEGTFQITDAVNDLSIMMADYISKITLKKDSVRKERSGSSYWIDAKVEIGDVSSYLEGLGLPLEIADSTYLEASFRESKNANISLYLESDFIHYENLKLMEPYIEINGSKGLNEPGVLTSFIFQSQKQEIGNIPETNDLLVEGVWFDNSIDFTASVQQEGTNSDVSIRTSTILSKDSIWIQFLPSNIKLFGDRWLFNEQNEIISFKDRIEFSKLDIYDNKELIGLSGVFSDQQATNLNLNVEKLNLNKINPFLTINLQGLLDGKFSFFRENKYESFQFDGGFTIGDFKLNDFLVGQVRGESEWNADRKYVYSKIQVERENFRSIDMSGYYYPLLEDNQLEFNLKFDQADLRLAQPFISDYVSNLNGNASGTFNIRGSTSSPVLLGKCKVSNGALRLNYLNTDYNFSGDIRSLTDKLVFENFTIEDRKGSIAEVEGNISHTSFSSLLLDVRLVANNFEFLNTTAADNNLYYGSANGTGSIDISGPVNDILIKASIRTDLGTRFFIPVSEGGNVAQQEYITFVDFSDTLRRKDDEDYTLKGITLDFDIEVTPDAYTELIFDIKTGEIIKGRGRGNLKLTLDTDGEFHMFGPLEIEQGSYTFAALGLITKEFQVTSGSRITWFGDPYDAIIDLEATYLQRASFEPLSTSTEDNPALEEKVGVNVVLLLTDKMLSPEINFDLRLEENVTASDDRNALLAQVVNDEQELRRQVVSLLFLKRFSPPSSFLDPQNSVNLQSSAGEFFSNQVSYLISQLDENLEVEFDLAALDQESFNTLQLRLSYTFLDGRLTVTRGGGFSSADEQNSQVLKDIVGDWSVEYRLTDDGRLRAKVFSSTSDQRSASVQNNQVQDTGVSLRFVHSFNDFKELLSRSRQNAIRRRDEEEENREAVDLSTNTIYPK